MLRLLLIVATAQLALFVVVCGAILWELRRARLEARERGVGMLGKLGAEEEFLLVLDEELRQVRNGEQQRAGVTGDGP